MSALQLQTQIAKIRELTQSRPYQPDGRADVRSSLALPALIVPLENGLPVRADHAFAVTRDLSENGVGLLLYQPFRAQEVIVGFHIPDDGNPSSEFSPVYLRGEVQQNVPVGGGFWVLGIELIARIDEAEIVEHLESLGERLVPPSIESERPSELLTS